MQSNLVFTRSSPSLPPTDLPCPDIPYTQCVGTVCQEPTGPSGPFAASSLQECVNACTLADLDNRYAFFDPDATEGDECTCAVNCAAFGSSVASIQAAVESAAIQYKFPDVGR